MKKTLFPLGVVIVVISLLLAIVGPISAAANGQLKILKEDNNSNALVGATFVISPNPKTGTGDLTVVDNGINDEDSADGILLITGCNIDPFLEYTIIETVAPPGYTIAPPQTTIIGAGSEETPVTITFINEPPVGGEAQVVNTTGIVIPWIGLALAVTAGVFIVLKQRIVQS